MKYYQKPYMTDKELIRAYNAGYLDIVYKQLSRYGEITYDYNEDIEEGYYAGANRHLHIVHYGREWDIELLNGSIRALGFKYEKVA